MLSTLCHIGQPQVLRPSHRDTSRERFHHPLHRRVLDILHLEPVPWHWGWFKGRRVAIDYSTPAWGKRLAARQMALGGLAYAQGGWTLTSWVGFALPVIGLLFWVQEPR